RSFFFQAEVGIRDFHVTGVQTCALPISSQSSYPSPPNDGQLFYSINQRELLDRLIGRLILLRRARLLLLLLLLACRTSSPCRTRCTCLRCRLLARCVCHFQPLLCVIRFMLCEICFMKAPFGGGFVLTLGVGGFLSGRFLFISEHLLPQPKR